IRNSMESNSLATPSFNVSISCLRIRISFSASISSPPLTRQPVVLRVGLQVLLGDFDGDDDHAAFLLLSLDELCHLTSLPLPTGCPCESHQPWDHSTRRVWHLGKGCRPPPSP